MIASRPVVWRDSLIAASIASAPELPKYTRFGSWPGEIAASFAASCGMPS
jgi:hypothetical protein